MLNDLDKAFLQRFTEEDGMLQAVKKALLIGFDENLPKIHETDTDQVIGQRARAFDTAKDLLDKVFIDMLKYGSKGKIINAINLER